MLLTIPRLLIAVPVRERDKDNGQSIIDRKDQAVMFRWNKLTIIADHGYQDNFSNLNFAIPNKTMAYLGLKRYRCDSTEIGHIRTEAVGNRLYNSKWVGVHLVMKDGLCIYTCIKRQSEDVMDVRLTHWKAL